MNAWRSGGLSVELGQESPIPLDVSFECGPGELLALIGPSGSGKTTILRSIAGLDTPRRAMITLAGTVLADTAGRVALSPQARRCGLVFQDYALFPHMSVLQNVTAPLISVARPERSQRAREILALVNLEGLEQRRPHELSGGQCQRVAVARALARDPDVLLLDEPFSAVDQATRKRLQRELTLLRANLDIPVVLVTHDLREALSLADRIALLYHGRILQRGGPTEVMAAPASPRAARLLGQTNIFEGTIRAGDATTDGIRLDWCGLQLEARRDDRFAVGDRVQWVIPTSAIVLHRRRRPSRGERENPVAGRITETVIFGDETMVTLDPSHAPRLPLTFKVSTHAATRNGLNPGVTATVSLLADAIHLMPLGE